MSPRRGPRHLAPSCRCGHAKRRHDRYGVCATPGCCTFYAAYPLAAPLRLTREEIAGVPDAVRAMAAEVGSAGRARRK